MMSQQFRAMNMAMSTVIDSFRSLEDATGQAIDLAALNTAQRELQEIEANFDQIEDEIRQAEQAQNRLNNDINEGRNLMERFGGAVLSAVGAYVSFRGLEKITSMSDEYANTVARISMMNDGLQTTAELQEMIYQAAQNAYSPFDDTAKMVAKLGNNAASAFESSAEIVDFAELVQKQFSIAGTSIMEASNASLQLTQALGSGVLRGDELNSIFEQAPNIIQNIANYLDVPIGAIREMAREGELTADIVKASMFAAADDINRKFDSMPKTWGNVWTEMENYAGDKMASVSHRINDFINSTNFIYLQQMAMQAFDVIVMGINLVIAVLISFGDMIANVAQFFQSHWSIFEPILMVIAVVLGSIVTILLAKYAVLGLIRVATLAWAAAQWVVNAAYLGSPITWVLIAIIAIIALIVYALIMWGEQTATVIGFIIGLFMLLYARIHNVIANLWNIFAAIAEFFVNVWQHPVYSVKKMFYNLASNVLDQAIAMARGWDGFATSFVNAIISAVNIAIKAWNAFIEILPDGVASTLGLGKGTEFSYRESITSDLQGIKGALGDWVGEAPADYWEAPKMDFMDFGEAWNAGFDWGYDGTMVVSDSLNGLVEKAKGFLNYDTPMEDSALQAALEGYGLGGTDYGMGGLLDAVDDGNKAGKKTAGNTKKLADSVGMAADDLKYLRDLAERDVINRYTTGHIKIDVKNDNHINNEMDIDGIIDRFAEKLEEAVDTVAEGADGDV
ncbi:tape measure protein [Bacillus sp. OxB-1]|uniref:tape measure protein n=1 Tax=Bacillus sp. (strain OxB-1) TaxID=98228 RepID=UPI00130E9BC8|nr:tape measure protein [Bacillus sp. OxB-1]